MPEGAGAPSGTGELSGDVGEGSWARAFRLSQAAAPGMGREETNGHEDQLTNDKATEPGKSAIHESIGMEANPEHVDPKP